MARAGITLLCRLLLVLCSCTNAQSFVVSYSWPEPFLYSTVFLIVYPALPKIWTWSGWPLLAWVGVFGEWVREILQKRRLTLEGFINLLSYYREGQNGILLIKWFMTRTMLSVANVRVPRWLIFNWLKQEVNNTSRSEVDLAPQLTSAPSNIHEPWSCDRHATNSVIKKLQICCYCPYQLCCNAVQGHCFSM